MKAIEFKEVNVRFAENQEEYETLPACGQSNGMITCCMELTPEEIKKVSKEKKISITVLNFQAPAQQLIVHTHKPKLPIDFKTKINSDKLEYSDTSATFRFPLFPMGIQNLKRKKCIWITTITHSPKTPLQPISQTLV